MSSGSAMFKFLKPSVRPQPVDIQAAAAWGVAGVTTALYLVQRISALSIDIENTLLNADTENPPFDWLKKTFLEKPDPEEK